MGMNAAAAIIESQSVAVRIPLNVWGRMASEADHRGAKVEDLVVAAIHQVVHKSHRHATVIGLAVLGHTDRVIAELTGETREFVGEARRLANLPANSTSTTMRVDEEQTS